jgi:ABC-2 type transport system permease protein
MGFVASLGRGYLPAIGVLGVIVAITQVAVLFGTGGWFPFAVPGLMAVAGAEGIPEPTALQVLLVPAVAAVGIWLTIHWWHHAEVVSRFSRSERDVRRYCSPGRALRWHRRCGGPA